MSQPAVAAALFHAAAVGSAFLDLVTMAWCTLAGRSYVLVVVALLMAPFWFNPFTFSWDGNKV